MKSDSRGLRVRRVKSQENMAVWGPNRKAVIAKHCLALGWPKTVTSANCKTWRYVGSSQKQPQRKQQWQHMTLAQDEFGGQFTFCAPWKSTPCNSQRNSSELACIDHQGSVGHWRRTRGGKTRGLHNRIRTSHRVVEGSPWR